MSCVCVCELCVFVKCVWSVCVCVCEVCMYVSLRCAYVCVCVFTLVTISLTHFSSWMIELTQVLA